MSMRSYIKCCFLLLPVWTVLVLPVRAGNRIPSSRPTQMKVLALRVKAPNTKKVAAKKAKQAAALRLRYWRGLVMRIRRLEKGLDRQSKQHKRQMRLLKQWTAKERQKQAKAHADARKALKQAFAKDVAALRKVQQQQRVEIQQLQAYQVRFPAWRHPKQRPGQRIEVKGLFDGHARWIPGGPFLMGSRGTEAGRYGDERPRHWVYLSQSYWMMETEVTQLQFKKLMGYNPSHFKSCGGNCPVENVSWHEAAAFANALSKKEGRAQCFLCRGKGKAVRCRAANRANYVRCVGWRLPTEAEWERAYQAGTQSRFYTGKCITTTQANFDGNKPLAGCVKGSHRGKTVGVGSFPANPWELKDMAGNVWEWVFDWRGAYQASTSVDPLGPKHASDRGRRGGSWGSLARDVRGANRDSIPPSRRYSYLGFRLLRVDHVP